MLPLQGAWVRSLVRELRSYMLRGAAEKKKIKMVFKFNKIAKRISYVQH